jgi:hypothetical protein
LFHIVGCNHGIQIGTGGFTGLDTVEQNEQRAHFREFLEQICGGNGIREVFEENGSLEKTAGAQLADGRGITWTDMNTTNEDKDRMGIPRDYILEDHTEEQKAIWNYQREQFMVAKIHNHLGDSDSVLIICGFEHMQPIAALLGTNDPQIHTWDYRTRNWYRPGIFVE